MNLGICFVTENKIKLISHFLNSIIKMADLETPSFKNIKY